MTTLASLKSQLDKIQEAYGDKEKCGYFIRAISDEKYKGQRFLTPDDALAWCYEDAYKRKLPYLKVALMVALMFDVGNVTDLKIYGFSAERSDLNMIIHQDVHNNMLWCMSDTGTQGRFADPMVFAYPNEKPQYEVLDFIRNLDKEWCRDMAHMSVVEHEDDFGHASATRDLEDYYSIVTGIRPPNSLPESKYTCDICRHYDLLSLRNLPEGTDAKDLRDDELIAIIKSQGGEVPKQ